MKCPKNKLNTSNVNSAKQIQLPNTKGKAAKQMECLQNKTD